MQLHGQLLDQLRLPSGDSDWALQVPQGVLDDDTVLLAAQEQADGGLISGMAQHVVDGGEIEVQLAHEGRIERDGLELDNDVTAQLQVIKQEVNPEILVADFERHLPTD